MGPPHAPHSPPDIRSNNNISNISSQAGAGMSNPTNGNNIFTNQVIMMPSTPQIQQTPEIEIDTTLDVGGYCKYKNKNRTSKTTKA